MYNETALVELAKNKANEMFGSEDFENLSNTQLISVVAYLIELASQNPDIDSISRGLERRAQITNRALGF